MGTQGASGIRKFLIGSNTSHVIKDSQVPVLAVPFEASFKMVKNITVAIDLSWAEKRLFNQLFILTKNWKLSYKALQIENKDMHAHDFSTEDIGKYLQGNFPDTPFTITTPSVDDTLIDHYLKESSGSLLVMFSNDTFFVEYLFNKSKIAKMAYHTLVPLLVIK
jgi:hypothetical protein